MATCRRIVLKSVRRHLGGGSPRGIPELAEQAFGDSPWPCTQVHDEPAEKLASIWNRKLGKQDDRATVHNKMIEQLYITR